MFNDLIKLTLLFLFKAESKKELQLIFSEFVIFLKLKKQLINKAMQKILKLEKLNSLEQLEYLKEKKNNFKI